MKLKTLYACILYACLSILTISVMLLVVRIFVAKPYVDSNMKLCIGIDIIPDEETARQVADVIVASRHYFEFAESWFDDIRDSGHNYRVDIYFHEESNEWVLSYIRLNSEERATFFGGGIGIRLCRDCGMITEFLW
jgi:hypothetical protein